MSLAIRKNLTTEPINGEQEGKSRFAVSKLNLSARSLTKFLKKPKKSAGQISELKDLPDVRAADRHPDAPARQPIFASSDLGAPLAEKIQRFDHSKIEQNGAESTKQAEASSEAEASTEKAAAVATDMISQASVKEAQAPVKEAQAPVKEAQAPAEAEVAQKSDRSGNNIQREASAGSREDLSSLSIAQLADRLEAGLRRLEALERRERSAAPAARTESPPKTERKLPLAKVAESLAPVAIPPLRSVEPTEVETQASRQADMDAALKAALGTLERMTAHR